MKHSQNSISFKLIFYLTRQTFGLCKQFSDYLLGCVCSMLIYSNRFAYDEKLLMQGEKCYGTLVEMKTH